MSWNLMDFARSSEPEREHAIASVIRELSPDVLAVQELVGPGEDGAQATLRALGEATGLVHRASDGRSTVAVADTDYHVAVLWRHGIAPVTGTWQPIGRRTGGLWHSLASISLDIGGPSPVRFASYHADPFRPEARFAEAARVASMLRRDKPIERQVAGPGLVGADWNNIASERALGGTEYYDADPYLDQPWCADLTYQVRWDDDDTVSHQADRRPAERLRRAGLLDAAAHLGAPWEPTVGHWPGDPFPSRRIDAIRTTPDVAPALVSYRVVRTDQTVALSDHLPIVVDVDFA